MIQDILEQKLANDGFIHGKDLFRNFIPGDCSIGVMTRIPLQGLPVDPNMPNYYRGRIQVITRHKEPGEGELMAARVQRVLTMKGIIERYPANEVRGEIHLNLFMPDTLPIVFPRLQGGGYEWSQHFQCIFGAKMNV